MTFSKLLLLIFISTVGLTAKSQSKDSLAVLKATQTFVKSFTSFDWKVFKNTFSSKATIFFPTWEQGKRRTGQKEVEDTWTEIFPEFIDSTKKFDFKIEPKDILIQLYENTAIVTFHLGGGDFLSRRTIVFVKENKDWKIVHLHASNLSKAKDSQ